MRTKQCWVNFRTAALPVHLSLHLTFYWRIGVKLFYRKDSYTSIFIQGMRAKIILTFSPHLALDWKGVHFIVHEKGTRVAHELCSITEGSKCNYIRKRKWMGDSSMLSPEEKRRVVKEQNTKSISTVSQVGKLETVTCSVQGNDWCKMPQ